MYLQKQFTFFWHSLLLSSSCLAMSIDKSVPVYAVPVLGQEIPNTNPGKEQLSWQKTGSIAPFMDFNNK